MDTKCLTGHDDSAVQNCSLELGIRRLIGKQNCNREVCIERHDNCTCGNPTMHKQKNPDELVPRGLTLVDKVEEIDKDTHANRTWAT